MSERVKTNQIPEGLRTYFQEYDPAKLNLDFFSFQADAVGADQRAILREEFEDPTLFITFDKEATFVANWRAWKKLALGNWQQSSTAVAARALAYFEDAEKLPMPRMIDRTPWTVMKRFLERQALEVGRKH